MAVAHAWALFAIGLMVALLYKLSLTRIKHGRDIAPSVPAAGPPPAAKAKRVAPVGNESAALPQRAGHAGAAHNYSQWPNTRRQYPLQWPPPLIPPTVHAALTRYGEWHTREARRFFNSSALQDAMLRHIEHPEVGGWPQDLPRIIVAELGGQGLAGSTSNAIDMLLLGLMTWRLFFIVSEAHFHWDRWLWSPYFQWHDSRVARFTKAFNQAAKRRGYPMFLPGWSCSKWPHQLKDQNLNTTFPSAFYAYNDGNTGHPWLLWLTSNRHHLGRLQELGFAGRPVEAVHGALQAAAFQPNGRVVPALNAVLRHFTAPVVIGMHFRTSGNPKWGDPGRLGPSQIQCHFRCAMHILEALEAAGVRAQVFVTADRKSEREKAKAIFGKKHPGTLVMQNLTSEIAHMAKSRGSDASTLECLVDFLALAGCDRFVLTKSGFSAAAAFRSGRPFIVNPYPKFYKDASKCHDITGWCGAYPTQFPRRFFFGHKTGCLQTRPPPLLSAPNASPAS